MNHLLKFTSYRHTSASRRALGPALFQDQHNRIVQVQFPEALLLFSGPVSVIVPIVQTVVDPDEGAGPPSSVEAS